ncbi:hypothetical protein HIM_10655 [Hirsutella minnesotensis 3608]|uniref:Protein CAP22 n=1 Tax=Hirsutella minnesotensis 3608 TaxID=1043627 RepID=A0A0F7ZRP3_9HYPO|nr:hypothetical protein HIM_10655 [Hirsutella minnesotensis 3608]
MYTGTKLILAAAPFFLTAQALDVPIPCRTICGPIDQLQSRCDTDLPSDNDIDERRLENQCICSNRSFDVGRIMPLCASCMQQNASPPGRDDDDDNRADAEDIAEINNLMSTCRLSSTSYSPAATSLVQGIAVNATPLTGTNQLSTATGASARPTGQTASSNAGGGATATAGRNGGGSGTTGTQGSRASGTTNAAAGLKPLGGVTATGMLYVAASFLAGGLLL